MSPRGDSKAFPEPHTSASAITSLLICFREWYYSYISKRQRQDRPIAFAFGTAIHKALELFYLAIMEGRPLPDLDAMGAVFHATFVEDLERSKIPINFGKENPADFIRRGAYLLKQFLISGYRPERVLAVEKKFRFKHAALSKEFVGFIDLIAIEKDAAGEFLAVVDHKTSKRKDVGKLEKFNLQVVSYAMVTSALYPQYDRVKVYHQDLISTKTPQVILGEFVQRETDRAEAFEAIRGSIEFEEVVKNHPNGKLLCQRVRDWKCPTCGHRDICNSDF